MVSLYQEVRNQETKKNGILYKGVDIIMGMAQKELERVTMPRANRPRKSKRISVSSKRQISIPKEFFEQLNIGDEVTLELYRNHLVLRPIHESFDDFSDEILEDLVSEGFSGKELITEFKHRKAQIKKATESLIAETLSKGKRTTIEDLFGEEDDEV